MLIEPHSLSGSEGEHARRRYPRHHLEFRLQSHEPARVPLPGESWADGTSGEERVSYTYDANGNLTEEKTDTYSGGWSETLKWVYAWNPRDQMKQATKYLNGSGSHSGYVEYQYCLSCDGALSKRLQYNASDQLTSEKRYEYEGLNLLRVDERCDADGDGVVEAGETTWRMVEVATHRPGQLGALVGKRVYSYPTAGNRCVSNGYTVYTYGYDAVGNVAVVYTGGGDEALFFAQDAFGNELPIAAFGSSDWADARDDYGVNEHQTGKVIDPFTGQYYFHARWYDSVVGRFTTRTHVRQDREEQYAFSANRPSMMLDPTGQFASANAGCGGCNMEQGKEVSCPDACSHFAEGDNPNGDVVEPWFTCMINEILRLAYFGDYWDKMTIESCCRKLGGPQDDEYGNIGKNNDKCFKCHCFLKICEMDLGLMDDDRVWMNYELGARCYDCYVSLWDLWSLLLRLQKDAHDPPEWDGIGRGINCQEWAEKMLEETGITHCEYQWYSTW